MGYIEISRDMTLTDYSLFYIEINPTGRKSSPQAFSAYRERFQDVLKYLAWYYSDRGDPFLAVEIRLGRGLTREEVNQLLEKIEFFEARLRNRDLSEKP